MPRRGGAEGAGAHSRSPRRPSSGRVLTFGRHQGLRYDEVRQQQPGYCRWALAVRRPTGDLRHFVQWLRRHAADGAEDGEAGVDVEEVGSVEDSDGSGHDSDDDSDGVGASLRFLWAELARLPSSSSEDEDGAPPTELLPLPGARSRARPGRGRGAGRGPGRGGPPAMADVLEQLPRVPYSQALFDGSPHPSGCPICLEDFEAWEPGDREIVLTPCFHVFHRRCLAAWLAQNRGCPSCRWDVTDTGEQKASASSRAAPGPPPVDGVIDISDDEEW